MTTKPITYILEMRVEVTFSHNTFYREIVYGYYSCLGKAKKDIDDMKKYAQERGYILKGYRIFTLPNGYCALTMGEKFYTTTVQKAIQMSEM